MVRTLPGWRAIAPSSFFFLVARPGVPLVASLLLVAMPFVTSSDALALSSKTVFVRKKGLAFL